MMPKIHGRANQRYVSQSLLDFYEGGDLFSLCLFFLLGKQSRIMTEGVALKSSVFVAPWLRPVCVVLKRASVSHREEEYPALFQLHITQPPCWATGSRYACWDKLLHNWELLNWASLLQFPTGTVHPVRCCSGMCQGRGLSSCRFVRGSSRGWANPALLPPRLGPLPRRSTLFIWPPQTGGHTCAGHCDLLLCGAVCPRGWCAPDNLPLAGVTFTAFGSLVIYMFVPFLRKRCAWKHLS